MEEARQYSAVTMINDVKILEVAISSLRGKDTNLTLVETFSRQLNQDFGIPKTDSLRMFYRSLEALKIEILQRFQLGPMRIIALKVIDDMEEIFTPNAWGMRVSQATTSARRADYIKSNFVVFDYLDSVGAKLPDNKEQVISEIRAIIDRCKSSDKISEKHKSILENNLELVAAAMSDLELKGRSDFRCSMLTAAGTLSLELKDPNLSDKAKEVFVSASDLILRVAGLAEVTEHISGLLPYYGNVAGLLPAPEVLDSPGSI